MGIVYRWGSHASGTRGESRPQLPAYERKLRDEWGWPRLSRYYGPGAEACYEADDRRRQAIASHPEYRAQLAEAAKAESVRRAKAPDLSNPFTRRRAPK